MWSIPYPLRAMSATRTGDHIWRKPARATFITRTGDHIGSPVRVFISFAASRGIEPPTHALGKRRSIRLSYEAVHRMCCELVDRVATKERAAITAREQRILIHNVCGNERLHFVRSNMTVVSHHDGTLKKILNIL